jgi:hypothetical protein
MSLIVNSNRIIQGKSIGYEIIDDPILGVTYSVDTWVRPADWISVPTPATGSEVAYMLVGVYETGPNFLTIQGAGSFSVDWGDGSSQIVGSGSYARKEFLFGSYSAGTLTTEGFRQALVTVTPQTPGTFTTFDLDNFHSYSSTNYRANVLEIKMSGPNLSSLVLQTSGTTRFDRIRNFEFVGTHSVTNFSNLLQSCEGLRKVKIDCQGVTNTSSMFQNCHNLREVDITNLNSVTNMSSMFNSCYSLNTLPTINAASCSNMSSMFASCFSMEESPILINTSNVTDTSSMFSTCNTLRKVNSFTTSNVTTMASMFLNCYVLQTIPLLDTRWVTNFTSTFQDCFQLNYIPLLNTASASTMVSMFSGCRSLVSDRRFRGVPFLETQNVTSMASMFLNCIRVKTIPQFNTRWVTSFANTFQGCFALSEVPLLNTASASNMQQMFEGCRILQTVPLFNTQNVTNFSSMFRSCFEFNECPNFNMATASLVNSMFECNTTTDQPGGSLYTIPDFNFSSTIGSINMSFFLSGQRDLVYIPTLNTIRVTNMNGSFYNCTELIEFPTLNLSNVTNTYAMFRNCINLRKVGVINIPSVTTMGFMFINCFNLQFIENIITSNSLTIVTEAFRNCYRIRQIPQFNTTQVATTQGTGSPGNSAGSGFFALFADCWALQSEPGLTASNVRDFRQAFQNCYSLKTAPSYSTSLATSFGNMFNNCRSLETVPVYNISSITDLNQMFENCVNITSVTFSNISLTNNVEMGRTFLSCLKLRTVSMPGIRTSRQGRMFEDCRSLTNIGTFSVVSTQASLGDSQGYTRMFLGCSQLTNLSNLTFNPSPLSSANDFRNMFDGCNSLVETPFFSMTSSVSNGQTSTFNNCFSLSKINATASKFTTTYASCNLNYDNILNVINSHQNASLSLTLADRTISFLDNPGLPEMMDFYNRKLVYDKGYTYSTGTYPWSELRHYVNAGDTFSYTGTGNTFSDVSGWTYFPNVSPTFSTSTSTADGTLLNSPTFTTNNFLFNGSNQAITFGSSSVTLLTTVTIFAVVEPVTLPVGSTVSIFGRYGSAGQDNYFLDFTDQKLRFGFRQNATTNRIQRILNKTFNTGQRYFVAARFTNSGNNCIMWVDGVQETSFFSDNVTTQTMDSTSTSVLSMGGNVAANSSYANIRIYTAGVYNRALSNEEIEGLQSLFRRQGIL